MKILVPVKRVLDYTLKPRIKADGSGVDLSGQRMSMNPFDEIAIEQALRMREAGVAREVLAVSCGDATCHETLRVALAMGADRAMHVDAAVELQPLAVAKLLKSVALSEQPDLILMGKQAIDDDASQTGPMLAAMLGWPQATFTSGIELDGDSLRVRREIDGGQETLTMRLPAVVTVDLRLNSPRYASLPNIMKARKKTLETHAAIELAGDITPRLQTLRVREVTASRAGVMLEDVAALVRRLREAGWTGDA